MVGAFIYLPTNEIYTFEYFIHRPKPVSYTHLDVYKRQKVASLKNKVELKPSYKYDMYIDYYYKLMFKNTWFEEVCKTYDIKSYI